MKRKLITQAIAGIVLGIESLSPLYAASSHTQHAASGSSAVKMRPDVTFTLRTDIADGKDAVPPSTIEDPSVLDDLRPVLTTRR